VALVGSSTKLAKAIKKANGGVKEHGTIPVQAHHLLSSNVVIELDYEYRSRAKRLMANSAGYKLNAAPNGINLPTHFGHQMKIDKQRHCGNHWDTYYANVKAELRPIYDKFETEDVCKDPVARQKFLGKFKDAEDAVRAEVEGAPPSWWLYDWSEELWTHDYRDEGTGNMKLTRKPDKSYEAGKEWVAKKSSKGEIKRRYIEQKTGSSTKNVVNRQWYSVRSYAVPTGIY
jgi:hypothetical protein